MSINSINNISGCYICTARISEATRRKLLALGINPDIVSSESEAKIIIENIVKTRKSENIPVYFNQENEKQTLKTSDNDNSNSNSEKIIALMDYESNINKMLFKL